MYNFKVVKDDIVFDNNVEVQTVDGNDEITQSIERILSTRKGEFFLDAGMGMDYSELEKKNYNEDIIIDNIREAIFQEDRVSSIENITIEVVPNTRQMIVKFGIIVGEDILTGEVTM